MENRTLNSERTKLLSSADAAAQLSESRKEMKSLIDFLKSRYNDEDGSLNIYEAMIDMGLKVNDVTDSCSISITGNQTTTFCIKNKIGSNDARTELIRLLGVYLFTSELKSNTNYIDKTLSQSDEQKINSFQLIISKPDINFNEYVTIDQLIKWSIETKVPLPILRETLSI